MKISEERINRALYRALRVPGYCKNTPEVSNDLQSDRVAEAISMKFFGGVHNPTSRPWDGEAQYWNELLPVPHDVKSEHARKRTAHENAILLKGEAVMGSMIRNLGDGDFAPNWAVFHRFEKINPVIVNVGFYNNDLQYVLRYRFMDGSVRDYVADCLDSIEMGHVNLSVPKVNYNHWKDANPEIWLTPYRTTDCFSPSFKRHIEKFCKINMYAGEYECEGHSIFNPLTFNDAISVTT